ncbi:MAG: hypothetical protein IT376_06435 [Polyangiaceae bacterium]|nr:hypothetical protein [Polyangiaceae bacterium]
MRRALAGLALAGLLAHCTHDFDSFEVGTAGGAGADAGTDASSGGAGGAGAVGGGGSGGIAGTGGAGGSSGAPIDASDAPSDSPPDGGCGPGEKPCVGGCARTDDPAYGCASPSCVPCSFAAATARCDLQGQCTPDECLPDREECDGDPGTVCETNVHEDEANCLGCGLGCALANAVARCSPGGCVVDSCVVGWDDCDGDDATGCETDLRSPTDCGACGTDCSSLGNYTCVNRQCVANPCAAPLADCDGVPGCETNTDTSAQHCGYCSNACGGAHATGTCAGGQCQLVCDSGWGDCDGVASNGCETNLGTSSAHCGACQRACSSAGAVSASCSGGVCTSLCQPGYGNCEQPAAPSPDDGCETALATDAANCGGCGRACSTVNVSTAACAAGRCTSTCTPGYGNCSQPAPPAADDGCEIAVDADPSNCGACGRVCSSTNTAARWCSAGQCAPTCSTGWADCSTPAAPAADDGCEKNVQFDPDNCGACGRSCSTANVGTRACSGGLCAPLCSAPWLDCSQPAPPAADDGCELNGGADVANCGACGRACSSTNTATRRCTAGACDSTCTAGWGNCGQPSAPSVDDGCEVNLQSTTAHCGGCGRACSNVGVTGGATCAAGLCTSACSGTLGNCSRPAAPAADDGCEADLATDATDCGACGHACSGANVTAVSCSLGVCDPVCDLGRVSCTTPAAPTADDGCEASRSATHCGVCSNSCDAQNGKICASLGGLEVCRCDDNNSCRNGGGSGTCNSGTGKCECPINEVCRFGESCNSGSDCSCNGGAKCTGADTVVCCQDPPGCRDLATDAFSCGACGRECPPGFVCQAAACRCDQASDCDGGGSGTCNASGLCVCGAATCAAGERCLASGTCG